MFTALSIEQDFFFLVVIFYVDYHAQMLCYNSNFDGHIVDAIIHLLYCYSGSGLNANDSIYMIVIMWH